MSTRSLVIAVLAVAFGFATVSGVQAESKNNSRSDKSATSYGGPSGTGQATKKAGEAQASKKKKQSKPAISDITITKTKDKASPQ